MTADHYAALGLAANASLADIKKAFRQKASFYHPDRNTAPDAAQRFAEVQKAYEVLSDDFLFRPRGSYFLPETGTMRTFVMVGRT